MINALLKFLPVINFAPDTEGEGNETPELDQSPEAVDERLRERLHPDEAAMYNKDGSIKGSETEDDGDDKGDDSDDSDDKDDNEAGDGDDKDGDDKDDDKDDEVDLNTVPEDGKYKIQIPDDMDMDTELLAEMEPLWKEKGTTHAEAQVLVDKYVEGLNKQAQASEDTQTEIVNKWYEETTTDKEYGGENLDKNVALGKKAIKAYGDENLNKVLAESGLGVNLSMLKFMAKVGALVEDDDVPTDGGNPQSNLNEAGVEETLYGKTTPSKRV